MTREEEVQQACEKWGESFEDRLDYLVKKGGFIRGAEWADENPKNVWHDSSEHPLEDGAILYQTTLGQFRTVCDGKCGEGAWKVFAKDYGVMRWAYISDILPKGGER